MRKLVRNAPMRPSPGTSHSYIQPARTSLLTSPWFKRYYQYSKERFSLKEFVPLSIIVSLLAALGTQAYLYGRPTDVSAAALSVAAVFLLFLRLRLLDELKDLEHDRHFYPARPLPRGLVRPRELALIAAAVFLVEALLAASGGARSLGFFAVVMLYSLLTLNEFFVRNWLRKHFTVYVLSHELLVLPLCLYLYSLNGFTLLDLITPYFWLLTGLIAGQLFLLEVMRKVRPKEIEVASADTYTARYGIVSACILAGSLALGVAVFGIITATVLGSSVAKVGYLGLALLGAVGFSLRSFSRRPNRYTAKTAFNWSTGLVVATGSFFILAVWFVE